MDFVPASQTPPIIKDKAALFEYVDTQNFVRAEDFEERMRAIESFLMYNDEADALIAHLGDNIQSGQERGIGFLTAVLCVQYQREKYLKPERRENLARLKALFNRRLERDGQDVEALINLAQVHFLLGDKDGEAEYLRRAFALKPQTARQARILADEQLRRGDAPRAEEVLIDAQSRFKPDARRENMLLFVLLRNGKYEEAETLAASIRPATRAYALALERTKNTLRFLRAARKHNLRYAKRLLAQSPDYVRAHTSANYNTLAQILRTKQIPLIAVQYPMREIAPLMEMLKRFPETVFVDNCSSFVHAVMERGYGHYFADCFAGDFGHCTDAGNMLLANNIADVVVPLLKPLEEKSAAR